MKVENLRKRYGARPLVLLLPKMEQLITIFLPFPAPFFFPFHATHIQLSSLGSAMSSLCGTGGKFRQKWRIFDNLHAIVENSSCKKRLLHLSHLAFNVSLCVWLHVPTIIGGNCPPLPTPTFPQMTPLNSRSSEFWRLPWILTCRDLSRVLHFCKVK